MTLDRKVVRPEVEAAVFDVAGRNRLLLFDALYGTGQVLPALIAGLLCDSARSAVPSEQRDVLRAWRLAGAERLR